MPHDARKCLDEIHFRATAILRLQTGRTLVEFQNDIAFRWAVEWAFEVIGETLSRLNKLDAGMASQIPRFREIISFRNLLAHGYDVVDPDVVWKIVQDDLPILLDSVTKLLSP